MTAVACAAASLAGLTPGRAAASGCITSLPIHTTLPSPFAASYQRSMGLAVRSTAPEIRDFTVGLYTFGGVELTKAAKPTTLTSSATLHLALRFPLQPGSYTLYAIGEPNADPACGPKHSAQVVRLRDCISRLPVMFPKPHPSGQAADYGAYLSFKLGVMAGQLLRHISVTVTSADGQVVGRNRIPVLFGTVTNNVPLTAALEPGSYTVDVQGFVGDQPRSCGSTSNQMKLDFK